MTKYKYTYEDFLAKIAWEGGIVNALEYGLSVESAPDRLKEDWKKLSELYDQMRPIINRLEDQVSTATI